MATQVFKGKIASLKRFKDDAREVTNGMECGIGIANFTDVKEGDVIEGVQHGEAGRRPGRADERQSLANNQAK